MSNQLHRRLAFRAGGGVNPDVSTDSIWDSSDLSSMRVYSHLELYKRYKASTGTTSSTNPWRFLDNHETNPLYGVGGALFVAGGTSPIVVFGGGGIGAYTAYTTSGQLFRRHEFTNVGESWARTKIAGHLEPLTTAFTYNNTNDPDTISSLLHPCTTRDVAGRHWYFFQTANQTDASHRYENTGFVPISSYSETTPTRTTANVTTNYGARILHVEATVGDNFPLESATAAMQSVFAEPGEYTYGAAGTVKTYNSWGFKSPFGNRDLWDFTLKALKNQDMSPAGYFTNNFPIRMQVVDGGSKMFFLSAISVDGQALSMRSMTSEYDITTLSTTNTTRAMTDFQASICEALGYSSRVILWIWFKFSPDGKKLLLLSNGGILAKFSLSNGFDLSTMSLVSAVWLPAHEYVTSVKFVWDTGRPSSFTGQDRYITAPILAADIDPEGQSLLVMVSGWRSYSSTGLTTPMPTRLVQYRL